MTDFVNPTKISDVVTHLVALLDGGADYSFDCTGNTEVMRQALEVLSQRLGYEHHHRRRRSGPDHRNPPVSAGDRAQSGAARRLAAQKAAPMCRKSWIGIWTAKSPLTR